MYYLKPASCINQSRMSDGNNNNMINCLASDLNWILYILIILFIFILINNAKHKPTSNIITPPKISYNKLVYTNLLNINDHGPCS